MSITTAHRAPHHRHAATYRHPTLAEENALAGVLRALGTRDGDDISLVASSVGMTSAELALWLSDRRVPTDWTLPAYAA